MDTGLEISDSRAIKAIDRLVQFGLNPTPMLDVLGNNLTNRVRRSFRSGTDPYGNKWAPIKHRDGQPLRDTGRLQRSMTHQVDSNGHEHDLTIGTNTVYARLQNNGGKGMEVRVRPHTRRITQAFGRRLRFPVFANVKGHTKALNIIARPFLPDADKGLPDAWERSAVRAVMQALNVAIEGGRQ